MDPNTAAILQGIHQANLQAQQANSELLNELVNLNKQIISPSAQMNKPNPSMVDTRGIGKPGTFKGEESQLIEWMAKLNAYIRASYPGAPKWFKPIFLENGQNRKYV